MKSNKQLIIKRFLALAALVGYFFAPSIARAQDAHPIAQSRQFERQAVAAYQNKNYAAYLNFMKQAETLRPNHPRLLYNLASANALNDQGAAALSLLRRLGRMGLNFHPEQDADFEKLSKDREFQEILKAFEKNRQPIGRSKTALTVQEKDLITESVAFDAPTKRFFISSVHKRKIIVVEPNGAARDFSAPADDLWSVLGIKIDEKRRLLWACTAAIPQMRGFAKTDESKSALVKYDLKTGKLLKKYLLETKEKHMLGDLAISRDGDVFATDSAAPVIYRVAREKDEIEAFLTGSEFASLQGVTFSPDEKSLFVADYANGIFRIDLAAKKINALSGGSDLTTLGIDGLYYHRGKLIAVQNGVNPQRIVEFELNKNATALTGSQTIEANHPDFAEPTLGTIVGGEFYYVANSQWEAVDQNGEIGAPEKLRAPVILRLPL